MPTLADLWDMGKRYVKDALPGGSLNPEVTRQGVLDAAAISTTPVPVLGDLVGLGADVHRYATEPESRTAGNFALSGLGLLPFVPAMTAWHGSPHKFDKFSLDKIGTGEGKTQQGVGGYLSETESIGQKYADRLADMHGKESGYLYKTDIPNEAVSRFANYDKPLNENPQSVQDAIRKLMTDDVAHNLRGYYGWEDINSAPVAAIMGALDVTNGNARAITSEALKNQGIPGIRYLDGGSRSAGQGSSNFVVFDPEMIRILERNGETTGLKPWKPGEYRPINDLLDVRTD